eukprot:scaffold104009_cov35-Attheya_sp.AAC.1
MYIRMVETELKPLMEEVNMCSCNESVGALLLKVVMVCCFRRQMNNLWGVVMRGGIVLDEMSGERSEQSRLKTKYLDNAGDGTSQMANRDEFGKYLNWPDDVVTAGCKNNPVADTTDGCENNPVANPVADIPGGFKRVAAFLKRDNIKRIRNEERNNASKAAKEKKAIEEKNAAAVEAERAVDAKLN